MSHVAVECPVCPCRRHHVAPLRGGPVPGRPGAFGLLRWIAGLYSSHFLNQWSSFPHSTHCPAALLARLFSHWCAQWYSPGHAQQGSGGTVLECQGSPPRPARPSAGHSRAQWPGPWHAEQILVAVPGAGRSGARRGASPTGGHVVGGLNIIGFVCVGGGGGGNKASLLRAAAGARTAVFPGRELELVAADTFGGNMM